MALENGIAEKIARLDERYQSLQNELREYKLSEKDNWIHASKQRAELYCKDDQLIDRISDVKIQVTKLAAIITTVGTIISIVVKFIF